MDAHQQTYKAPGRKKSTHEFILPEYGTIIIAYLSTFLRAHQGRASWKA